MGLWQVVCTNDHVSNLKCMGFLGIAWMIERVPSVVRSWCSEPQWDPHTRTDCIQSLAKGWRRFDQLTCTRPSSTRCAWQVGGTKAWHVLMSLGILLSHCYLMLFAKRASQEANVLSIFISLRLMPPAFAGLEIASSMARSTTKSSSSNNSTILSIASSMARSTTKSNSNSSNNQQQQ